MNSHRTKKRMKQVIPMPKGVVPPSVRKRIRDLEKSNLKLRRQVVLQKEKKTQSDLTKRKRAEVLRQQRGAYLSAIIENQPGMVWLKDKKGKFLAVNQAFAKACGMKTPERVVGKTDLDIWPKRLAQKYRMDDQKVMRKRGSLIVEEPIWDKGGRKWYETFKTVVLDENKTVIGTSGYARDITERKQAEEALKQSLSLERATLESTADGILVVDSQGKIADYNDRFAKMWRLSRKLLDLRNDQKALNTVLDQLKDPKRFLKKVHQLYHHPEQDSFDLLEFKDGRIFERYSHPQRIEGRPVGRVWSFRDVTEKKRAEESIREGRRQLLQIIDTVPHMIFAKDKEGRFLLVNRAVAAMYGKNPKDLIGVKRRDVHADLSEVEKYLQTDREVLATGKLKIISADVFTDLKGQQHILQTIKIPFQMTGVKETCILGVSVDVTEQKKVEEFRNDIVRMVSHELRTPLSIEKEGVNLLLDGVLGPISPDQKILLETVMRSINRLSRMINSLLDISRIETGKIELHLEKTVLADLMKDIVFQFKKRATEKGIALNVTLPGAEVQVLVDADKITQVLSNLVDNAIKFTAKGSVEISFIIFKNEVECIVQDTGIGISDENIAKMFDKFQQFARTAGPGEKGLGLGLSIAKGIIEMHGGRIWAKSQLGQGTRMTFTLPFYPKKGV